MFLAKQHTSYWCRICGSLVMIIALNALKLVLLEIWWIKFITLHIFYFFLSWIFSNYFGGTYRSLNGSIIIVCLHYCKLLIMKLQFIVLFVQSRIYSSFKDRLYVGLVTEGLSQIYFFNRAVCTKVHSNATLMSMHFLASHCPSSKLPLLHFCHATLAMAKENC